MKQKPFEFFNNNMEEVLYGLIKVDQANKLLNEKAYQFKGIETGGVGGEFSGETSRSLEGDYTHEGLLICVRRIAKPKCKHEVCIAVSEVMLTCVGFADELPEFYFCPTCGEKVK